MWDTLGWIHWEQVGVALEKELEMPPEHQSPPEAAQQVHIDLAVNLHHSNPPHSSPYMWLQQNQALGIPLVPPAHPQCPKPTQP